MTSSPMASINILDFIKFFLAAEWEIEEFKGVVTDWEVARGFEKA